MGAAFWRSLARPADALCPSPDLLQLLRVMAEVTRMDRLMDAITAANNDSTQMIDTTGRLRR